MGRRKKHTFKEPKMLSSRIENSDVLKIEQLLKRDRATVQEFLNEICRLYISGSIVMSGSNFVISGEEKWVSGNR